MRRRVARKTSALIAARGLDELRASTLVDARPRVAPSAPTPPPRQATVKTGEQLSSRPGVARAGRRYDTEAGIRDRRAVSGLSDRATRHGEEPL